MAPLQPDPAQAPQRQARRGAPRIIPAIPRRFARPPPAARPITPDESTTAAAPVTQREPTPQPAEETKTEPEHAATLQETPPTPDSKLSAGSSGEPDEPIPANSPARSEDDHVEAEMGVQGLSYLLTHPTRMRRQTLTAPLATSEEHANLETTPEAIRPPQPEPNTVEVNGDRPKPTVPTELPPEFYPRESPSLPPPTNFPVHPLQRNVEGLVFGGPVQESPAMPSSPQPTFARPPPGFAPHLPPQFFPGHSHHPSDPTASWPQPAYPIAPPPEAMYGNGHDYTSPVFPPGSAPYQAPYQAALPLQTAPLALNGTNGPNTLSPSKSQFSEARPASNFEEESIVPNANGIASRRFEVQNEGYEISRHLSGFFGNPEFTDYILRIRSPEVMFFSMPVHGALISRSSVILEALRRNPPPGLRTKDPRRLADILMDDPFVTSESVHEAIKILYGAPLLSAQSFLFGLSPYDRSSEQSYSFNEARRRMNQVISYAAAGGVMQIPEMQTCGLRAAKALLRWDTLDQVLHFALTADKTTVQANGKVVDSRLFETCAMPLLDDSLEFIAYNLPSDFSLYTLAPEMQQYPRLPTVLESKQPTHNPRLSKIRFGDAPPEDDLKPNHVTQILSTVLLSIPIWLLDRLLSHPAAANQVGWSGLKKISRDVIREREGRRIKALRTQGKPSPDVSTPRDLLENLYREEIVERSVERPSGFKLTAVRPVESV
jgi:hypothetical protein